MSEVKMGASNIPNAGNHTPEMEDDDTEAGVPAVGGLAAVDSDDEDQQASGEDDELYDEEGYQLLPQHEDDTTTTTAEQPQQPGPVTNGDVNGDSDAETGSTTSQEIAAAIAAHSAAQAVNRLSGDLQSTIEQDQRSHDEEALAERQGIWLTPRTGGSSGDQPSSADSGDGRLPSASDATDAASTSPSVRTDPIQLDSDKVEQVKNVMQGFSLPKSHYPPWALQVNDTELTQRLLQRLSSPSSSGGSSSQQHSKH